MPGPLRSAHLLAIVLAFAVAAPLLAGTSNVAGGKEVSGLVWFQDLAGTLSGRDGARSGSARIRASGSTEPGFALTLKGPGSLALDLSYTPLSLDTRFDASGGLSFGGATFGVVTDGDLKYRMPIYETDLRWIALDNRWFRLCGALCLKVVDADVQISSPSVSRKLDMVIPIPQAGVSGQVNLRRWLKVYGSFKFLDLELGPVSTALHDWEGGVIVDLNTRFKTLRGAAGYRKLSVALAKDRGGSEEMVVDIRHQGPFAEATLSF